MTDINVRWVLPTTREKGGALPVDEIDAVIIEQSADGGVSYVAIDEFPPDVLETQVVELDPGEWFFRGLVRDKLGQVGKPVARSILVADTSPPGMLLSLTLE